MFESFYILNQIQVKIKNVLYVKHNNIYNI